MITDKTEKEV